MRFAWAALLLLFCVSLTAQDVDDVMGDIAAELDEEGRLDDAAQEDLAEMRALADNPLDLNAAGEAELARLVFLSAAKAAAIVRHRRAVGKIRSVQELMTIRGLSRSDILRLRLFSVVGPGADSVRRPASGRLDILARVGRRDPLCRGFLPTDSAPPPYAGSPWKSLVRLRGSVGRSVDFGFVGENDAGEPQLSAGAGLMDFYGGFVCLTPRRGVLRKLVAGHFHARFGQGLGVWTGFGLSPTLVGVSAARVSTGISPTLSAAEGDYLRGAAAELRHRRLRMAAYASYVDADATIGGDSSVRYVATLRADGLHRTATERARRHNLGVTTLGGHVSVDLGVARVGVGMCNWRTALPLGSGGRLYLANRPSGDVLNTFSLDARGYVGRVHIFGEAAVQGRNAASGVVGADVDVGGGVAVSASLRRFGAAYFAAVQQPVARSGNAGGEGGATLGVSFSPLASLSLSGLVDVWRLRWLRANVWAPTSGWKFRFVASLAPSAVSELRLRVRHTSSGTTTVGRLVSPDQAYNRLNLRGLRADERVTSCKLSFAFAPDDGFSATTVVERTRAVEADGMRNGGYMVGQDFRVAIPAARLTLCASAAYFDTDSYSCRVFARQPRVLGDMSFASFSGEGASATAMAAFGPWAGLRVWLWASGVTYLDRETVGSGLDETPGPWRADFKVQVQWKLAWRRRTDYFLQ